MASQITDASPRPDPSHGKTGFRPLCWDSSQLQAGTPRPGPWNRCHPVVSGVGPWILGRGVFSRSLLLSLVAASLPALNITVSRPWPSLFPPSPG